jgi:hypothetical protein
MKLPCLLLAEADVIIAPINVRFWGVERTCA